MGKLPAKRTACAYPTNAISAMKKLTLALFATLFSLYSSAQSLQLTDGVKTKSFQPSAFFKIVMANPAGTANNGKTVVWGSIPVANKDSLTLLPESIEYQQVQALANQTGYFRAVDASGRLAVPTAEVLYLQAYSSKQAKKRKRTWSTIGGLLFITGATTALQAVLVDGGNSRTSLLVSGGIQIGTGIILAKTNGSKRLYLRNRSVTWQVK